MDSPYNVSAIFNVYSLSPFDPALQDEGNDEIEDKAVTTTWDEAFSDPIQVPIEPITRDQAKKFKEALNGLI